MSMIDQQITELETALPILKEKAGLGLIHFDSHEKASNLIRWHRGGRVLSEKQLLFVGRLLQRAKRKHKKVDLSVNATSTVDIGSIVDKVLERMGGSAGLLDADKIAASTEAKVLARVSESAERVLKEIEKRQPRKVEITLQKTDGKKSTLKAGDRHSMFEHLLRAASSRLADGFAPGIMLAGEASSGKTTGARQAAEALELKWHFNGAISMPHEMLGFIDAGGKYHRTPFREAYEHGGLYTFDEVDRSDPVALLAVNPHLANGVATFPDKQVKRHKDCIIVATANTWGLGADANYSGATKLDAAFLSRFPVRIAWDIDPTLEKAIVGHDEWLDRVRGARAKACAAGLKIMIDTRVAQAGAALIAAGYSLDDAARMTYLANLKPEQKQLIGG